MIDRYMFDPKTQTQTGTKKKITYQYKYGPQTQTI